MRSISIHESVIWLIYPNQTALNWWHFSRENLAFRSERTAFLGQSLLGQFSSRGAVALPCYMLAGKHRLERAFVPFSCSASMLPLAQDSVHDLLKRWIGCTNYCFGEVCSSSSPLWSIVLLALVSAFLGVCENTDLFRDFRSWQPTVLRSLR